VTSVGSSTTGAGLGVAAGAQEASSIAAINPRLAICRVMGTFTRVNDISLILTNKAIYGLFFLQISGELSYQIPDASL
jgi:hypothetical protein